jgi:RNA polymerase sigma-70 factor (ECF subfamily)
MSQRNGWQLERYLPMLRLQARQMHLDRRLRCRFDPSDLVDEAVLRAHKNLDQFQGQPGAELMKWMQTILANTLRDMIRKETARKRDVRREQPLEDAAITASSILWNKFLDDHQPSPSQEAERHERALRLTTAIDQLPEDQRDVVILHYLMEKPVAEIAGLLDRSEKAVAGLIYRGLRQLRKLMVSYS